VYANASNFAIGNVLSQNDETSYDHSIYFASKQLVDTKINYITTKEAMGMIYYVQKFQHYLLGYPFVFHVGHDALKYLIIEPQLIGHIAKLAILLQEFTYKTMVRTRKKHANIYII
jgi:hypothetical protein